MLRAAGLQLDPWPDLPLEAWSETYATLHLFTQIVGYEAAADLAKWDRGSLERRGEPADGNEGR